MSNGKKDIKLPMEQKLLTGGIAGVIGTSCIYPFDMIKTHLQAAGQVDGKILPTRPIDCIRNIIAKDGVLGFYRGLSANLIGVTPEKAIKLAVNEKMRELLENEGSISFQNEVFSGAVAGFCQVIATNPMEIVKLRMQLQSTLPKTERIGIVKVVSHLGLIGLYRGAAATWARDIPYSMIFFPAYSNAKEWLKDSKGNSSIIKNLSAGTTAGMVAAGLMTPMDVIKTRFQQKGGKQKYGNLLNVFKTTIGNEGLLALYKGVIPRMVTQGPLFGIALASFELTKWYMIQFQKA